MIADVVRIPYDKRSMNFFSKIRIQKLSFIIQSIDSKNDYQFVEHALDHGNLCTPTNTFKKQIGFDSV